MINGALSDFWYWLNSYILLSSDGIITLEKSLCSQTFLKRFKFFFCCKRVKTMKMKFRQWKSTWCLDIITLNNADSFLLQDNAILFHLGIIKRTTWFSWFELHFEILAGYIFCFLAHKTFRATLHYFSEIFSDHLFLVENLFFPRYIYF